MKKVIKWLCEHCGKEFKTPDKHFCRKDPVNKSCASCGNKQLEFRYAYEDDDSQEFYCQWAANYDCNDCTLMELSQSNKDWFDIRKPHFIVNCQHWIPRVKKGYSDVFQR